MSKGVSLCDEFCGIPRVDYTYRCLSQPRLPLEKTDSNVHRKKTDDFTFSRQVAGMLCLELIRYVVLEFCDTLSRSKHTYL